MQQPSCLVSSKKLPHFGFLPQTAELKYYAVSGFEIPSLPVLGPDDRASQSNMLEEILYRFQLYLLELHEAGSGRSISLQLTAHPEMSHFVSRVRIYVLLRSAQDTPEAARSGVETLAHQAAQCFPRGGMFNYGHERWLNESELEVAFHQDGSPQVAEIVKHEEFQNIETEALRYVPHRLWADSRRDCWKLLIENLAQSPVRTSVRVELTPTRLTRETGLESVTQVLQWFNVIDEDMARKASHGENVRKDGIMTEDMYRSPIVGWARTRPQYIQRGKDVFQSVVAQADRLFGIRVLLASEGPISQSVLGATRAGLCSPPSDQNHGWNRPAVHRDTQEARDSLFWMAQSNSQPNPSLPELYRALDLRRIVTAEEAVALFHLPIYDRIGQTSALSTADTPFVIPPETLDKDRYSSKDCKIRVGWLYQRERLLSPQLHGDDAQGFYVTTSDLMKPSLLVGAPGSGKTNLAVSLLIQLWNERVPFMVLDPSTGQEFRFLLGERSLRKDMVVYTAGDPTGYPLRFNPFSIPPGVSVRHHTTNLLAAFRASMKMWDPLPAVFEGALELLYTDERFCGRGRAMDMEDRGDFESPAPSMNQFAEALEVQLDHVLEQYQGSEQSIGVIRGGSVVRVQAIIKKLGSILNVPGNGGHFFQRLLQRPSVIELGALGDSSNIALLMAFMLGQVSGHVEYAYRDMAKKGRKREHVILIEEAHRLLAGGEGAEGKSAEDLNQMLAEVRKFGQGIMTLDQRPSSLVGGVLDNAFVKILTRLSDRVGFDRLADELNLNEAQRAFAHTRLKAGMAILLDRDAGMPVLMRGDNVKDALEERQLEGEAFTAQVKANAQRFGLVPPDIEEIEDIDEFEEESEAVAQAEDPAEVVPTPTEVKQQSPPTPATRPGTAPKSRERLLELFGEMVSPFLEAERPQFLADAHAALTSEPADIEAACEAADKALDSERQLFLEKAGELWDKLKVTAVGEVSELYQLKETSKRVRERMDESGASGPSQANAKAWFQEQVSRLLQSYLDRNRPGLRFKAYELLNSPERALEEANKELSAEELTALIEDIKTLTGFALVGAVAEEYQDQEAQDFIVRARAEGCVPRQE
jgi:hypothetical protein